MARQNVTFRPLRREARHVEPAYAAEGDGIRGADGGVSRSSAPQQASAAAMRPARYFSNAATVARITNVAISEAPSNIVASPSPVICHTISAVRNRAPM